MTTSSYNVFVVIFFLLLVGCQAAFIKDQSFQMARSLEAQAFELDLDGKTEQAISLKLKAYKYYHQNFKKYGDVYAKSCSTRTAQSIGQLYEKIGLLDKAEQIYKKCNISDAHKLEVPRSVRSSMKHVKYDCNAELVNLYLRSGRKVLASEILQTDPFIQQMVDSKYGKDKGFKKIITTQDMASFEENTESSFFDNDAEKSGKTALKLPLANTYKERGDFVNAERLYKELIEQSINNESSMKLMNFTKTAQFSGFGAGSLSWTSAVRPLADIYIQQERFSEASAQYQQLRLLQLKEAKTQYKKYKEGGLLSDLNKDNKDFFRNQYSAAFDEQIKAEIKLAGIEILQNDLNKAQASLALVQENYAKKTVGSKTKSVLDELENTWAWLYQKKGDYDKVSLIRDKQLLIDNKILNQAIWGLGNSARKSFINNQLLKHNILWNHYLQSKTMKSNYSALFYSLSRKGILQKTVSEINAVVNKNIDPELRKKGVKLQNKRKQLANLTLSGKNNSRQQALQNDVSQLEALLARNIQKLSIGQLKVTPKQIINKLGHNDMLIDFHIYRPIRKLNLNLMEAWNSLSLGENDFEEEHLVALIVDSNKIHLKELGPLRLIEKDIERYRNKIEQQEGGDQLTITAKSLYQKILHPMQSNINKKQRIYVVADGMLHLLPFKALQDNTGKYVVQSHEIINLSSARELVIDLPKMKAKSASIFASPLFQPEQRSELEQYASLKTRSQAKELKDIYFAALPGTLKEGENLYSLMQSQHRPVKLLTLDEATEKAIKAQKSPEILHLATHGYYLEAPSDTATGEDGLFINDPLLRSGLAFANANIGIELENTDKSNDDGILTALEVLQLDLSGTNLVTLSACETGVGEIKTGDGVYSLSRSFQEAGAKAVLSSLWSISDEATEFFMNDFYKRYLNGVSPQKALQQTQVEFINSKKWKHPFYWAAFTMTGKE